MTIPNEPERSGSITVVQRIRSICAVILSGFIVRLPPQRIKTLLTYLGRGSRPATFQQVSRARMAACTVSVRCAGMGCVLRSVAVYLDCRMQGVTPDWCTGFRSSPFAAHAWVEAAGVPVGEPAAISSFTTVIAVRPHSCEGRGRE